MHQRNIEGVFLYGGASGSLGIPDCCVVWAPRFLSVWPRGELEISTSPPSLHLECRTPPPPPSPPSKNGNGLTPKP